MALEAQAEVEHVSVTLPSSPKRGWRERVIMLSQKLRNSCSPGHSFMWATIAETQLLPVIINQYKTALSPAESSWKCSCWKTRLEFILFLFFVFWESWIKYFMFPLSHFFTSFLGTHMVDILDKQFSKSSFDLRGICIP